MKTTNVKIFGFSALAVAIIVALSIFFNDYKAKQEAQFMQEQERGDALAIKLHQRDSLINEYLTTFNQIEKDLNFIKEKENLIGSQTDNPEFTQDSRINILEDIQLVNALIEQNPRADECACVSIVNFVFGRNHVAPHIYSRPRQYRRKRRHRK